MLNKTELKAEIIRNGYNNETIAKALGMSSKTFYRRLNTGVFDTDEVMKLSELLKLKNPSKIFLNK